MLPRWSRVAGRIWKANNSQNSSEGEIFPFVRFKIMRRLLLLWSQILLILLRQLALLSRRVEDPNYEGVKRFILKLMFFYSKQSQFIRRANVIYSRVTCQVDRPAIYDAFSLEQTFKTTFSLLVLHMWLCLRRLKEEGKEGVELGQYLYEIYNHNLELRVSKAGKCVL